MTTHATGWKSAEWALAAAIVLLAVGLVARRYTAPQVFAAVAGPAAASAAFSHARGRARAAAAMADAVAAFAYRRFPIHTTPPVAASRPNPAAAPDGAPMSTGAPPNPGAPPTPDGMTPYKSGTRRSAATGETIYVFEFKRKASPTSPPRGIEGSATKGLAMKDQIVNFLTAALLKELHKALPDLPANADAQVSMMVSGAVGLVWDVAKTEGTKELKKLGSGELVKLFPQFATLAPAPAAL